MHPITRLAAVFTVLLLTVFGAANAFAEGSVFNQSQGTAIKGYDPVA
jgi:hypothetical protein